jgi:hypothetical protein
MFNEIGKRFSLKRPTPAEEAIIFYNGWIHGYSTAGIFITGADGAILGYMANQPGHKHDSTVSKESGLIPMLGELAQHGLSVVADAGFPIIPGIKRVAKRNENQIYDPEASKQITKARTAAEWSNNVSSTFRRLQTPMSVIPNQRRLIFSVTMMLHNLRTRSLGFNQVATYYGYFVDPDES